MTLCLDHIFICTSVGASEAEALIEAGFVEGSRNVHPGQGTANRRFFFKQGFLELLWVHDAREATSTRTRPTRLWERWSKRAAQANPFGLCFSPRSEADLPPPFASWVYQPAYLPKDKRVYFAEGAALCEPELFALSWPQDQSAAAPQPRVHGLPLEAMQAVSVGLSDTATLSEPMRAARDAGLLRVHRSDKPELVVEFASPCSIELPLPTLSVILRGRPRRVP